MPTTLHLGVTDLPYGKKGSKSTGDVAEILEARYGLVEKFVDMHAAVIQHDIENSLQGALETLAMGGPAAGPARALATAASAIEDTFKQSLTMQSYDGKIGGVPTGAALRGVNHRMKRPYVRRSPRPSFIDTGLFQSSFRVWAD